MIMMMLEGTGKTFVELSERIMADDVLSVSEREKMSCLVLCRRVVNIRKPITQPSDEDS